MTQGPKTREVYEGPQELGDPDARRRGGGEPRQGDGPRIRGRHPQGRRSQGTVDGCVKVLRLILGFAVDAGVIRSHPAARLRMDRQQRQEMHFLSESDVVLLAGEMRESIYERWSFWGVDGNAGRRDRGAPDQRVNLASAKAEVAENLGEASDGTLRFDATKTYQRRTSAPSAVPRLSA